jgi:hypothetical protein
VWTTWTGRALTTSPPAAFLLSPPSPGNLSTRLQRGVSDSGAYRLQAAQAEAGAMVGRAQSRSDQEVKCIFRQAMVELEGGWKIGGICCMRMVRLMFVAKEGRWIDLSLGNLTRDWLRRVGEIFAGVRGAKQRPRSPSIALMLSSRSSS